jgi:hypothetical protein
LLGVVLLVVVGIWRRVSGSSSEGCGVAELAGSQADQRSGGGKPDEAEMEQNTVSANHPVNCKEFAPSRSPAPFIHSSCGGQGPVGAGM